MASENDYCERKVKSASVKTSSHEAQAHIEENAVNALLEGGDTLAFTEQQSVSVLKKATNG